MDHWSIMRFFMNGFALVMQIYSLSFCIVIRKLSELKIKLSIFFKLPVDVGKKRKSVNV